MLDLFFFSDFNGLFCFLVYCLLKHCAEYGLLKLVSLMLAFFWWKKSYRKSIVACYLVVKPGKDLSKKISNFQKTNKMTGKRLNFWQKKCIMLLKISSISAAGIPQVIPALCSETLFLFNCRNLIF